MADATALNFLDRLLRELRLVWHVRHNVKDAAEALMALRASRDDLRDAIEWSPQQMRPEQVENWFKSVEEVDGKMKEVQRDYDNLCVCAGSCSPNIFSSYAISRRAVQKLESLKALRREYDSVSNLPGANRPASCIRKPVAGPLVGKSRHLVFAELLSYLEHEHAEDRIISIFGMAGTGKSELMRHVNNEFLPGAEKAEVFKFVVWVDNASSDVSQVSAVQDEIARRLKLGDLGAMDGDAEARAGPIFSVLKDASFLVLLDNLMATVSLADIGIPNPVYRRCAWKQKVVLTTRFKSVCGAMKSGRQINIECLDWDASWKLFTESLGHEQAEDRDIAALAKKVAQECGGLPIALAKIGRAMSTKVQPGDWRRTAEFLKSSRIHQIPGMEAENTKLLRDFKQSYDRGVFNEFNRSHRECFLCCALWPRGVCISKAELVDCWIGLGLICESSYDHSVKMGFSVISYLQDANLLLPGENAEREVKLQEVVRDMALYWIALARDCGGEERKWVVRAGVGLSAEYEVLELSESVAAAERVSLMHNSIKELPQSDHSALTYPRLALLMLQHNHTFTNISGAFLGSASALAYLDLSHTALEELPDEFGTLVMLQYLNLSFTPLRALPGGLRNLGRLKHLFLKHTSLLSIVPVGLFLGLTSLRVIDMFPSLYMDWEDGTDMYPSRYIDWEEGIRSGEVISSFASRPAFIESLGITVNSMFTARRLGHLMNVCTRRLLMTRFHSTPSVTLCPSTLKDLMGSFSLLETLLELSITESDTLEALVLDGEEKEDVAGTRNESWCLPKLEHLQLCGLQRLADIIWKNMSVSFFLGALLRVKIDNCSRLRNVSWVIQLHCLQHLELRYCARMECVVDADKVQRPTFPSLKTLVLAHLPELSSVCTQQVSFPWLEAIDVRRCDNLRRMNIKQKLRVRIQGTMDWWRGLEWDGDSNVEFKETRLV
ncbi:unnamed protein product [Alopecurus aequalis]